MVESTGPLPWQRDQWNLLVDTHSQGRLPHALLLTGIEGLGKTYFARQFIQYIQCLQPVDKQPCGQCSHCKQIINHTHPDYCRVTVEDDKSQISIEQIRALQGFMQLSQSSQTGKVALIYPAEAMNINSSNSLLKTLEEPPGSSVLILVSNQADVLPATIRSRCQNINFHPPEAPQASRWLAQNHCAQPERYLTLAQGSPCKAIRLADTVELSQYEGVLDSCLDLLANAYNETVGIQSLWSKTPLTLLMDWQFSLVRDLIRAKNGVIKPHFENQDRFEQLRSAASELDSKWLLGLYETLSQLGRLTHANLKADLYQERMILAWKTKQ